MAVDKYVLTCDVQENKLDKDGNIVSEIVAERGDSVPASLKDEQDELVEIGVLIPKDEFDEIEAKAWHAPTLNEVEAAKNLKDAGYSKSDLEKINEAAEAAATPLQVEPTVAGTGMPEKAKK